MILDVIVYAVGGALVLALVLAVWIRHRNIGTRERRVAEAAKHALQPHSSNPALRQVASAAGLPGGWQAGTDGDSGKTYYYNSATGESSWEPPARPKPEDFQNVMQVNRGRLRVL